MIRLLFLFLLLILCPLSLLAQQTKHSDQLESLVSVPFVCNVGDHFDYEVTESKYSDGRLTSKKTELVKLKILSTSEEEVVIAMQFVAQLDAAALRKVESDPLTKAMYEAWKELVVNVGISPNGVFQDVKNIEDIEKAANQSQKVVRQVIDDMKKGLTSDSKMRPEDLEQIFAMVMKNFGSTEAVVRKVVTPLKLIIQLVDTELDINNPSVEQTGIDLGFGSEMPATETYLVKSVDQDKDQAVFEFRQVIQGEEASKKFMDGMNRKMAEIQPGRKKESPKITVLSDSTVTATLDLKIGWPDSVALISKFNDLKDDKLNTKKKMEIRKVETGK